MRAPSVASGEVASSCIVISIALSAPSTRSTRMSGLTPSSTVLSTVKLVETVAPSPSVPLKLAPSTIVTAGVAKVPGLIPLSSVSISTDGLKSSKSGKSVTLSACLSIEPTSISRSQSPPKEAAPVSSEEAAMSAPVIKLIDSINA